MSEKSEQFPYRSEHSLDSLPIVAGLNGFRFQLTEDDLLNIECLVATGASAGFVATELGITEKTLHKAMAEYPRLSEAVRRGVAKDEQEITQRLRQLAVQGNIAAIMWYQKNKHSWSENTSKGGTVVQQVIVNTGIERAADNGTT